MNEVRLKDYVVSLLLALVAGLSLALELPDQSTVVVTDAGGAAVGIGTFLDGSLEIRLSEGASGFLTLSGTTGSGEIAGNLPSAPSKP